MRKLLALAAGIVLLVVQLQAQTNRTVTGKVTDDKGSPLTGVTVSAGSERRTVTDNSGNFTIQVSATAKSLHFTYVGYNATDVIITGKSSVSLSLTPEDKTLSEVVVVGYGVQKKREVTGAISRIGGGAVADKPAQSFDQNLGGRAAGVQITIPSGVLNAPPVIRVRGTNSISLSSYPLIVVDGVPSFTGDFSSTAAAGNILASINPNDIESIDIAKDAAATAIYGSRAANGVVFVTTKKGKAGRSRVTVDSWVGWSKVQRLPDLLNASQYTDYKNEALKNAGTYNANTNAFALTNGPDGKPINTNWYNYVYRNGFQHSNTVSISGANESTSYYFSAGYTEQQGIIQRNDFKRLGILMNIDHKIGKAVNLGGKKIGRAHV